MVGSGAPEADAKVVRVEVEPAYEVRIGSGVLGELGALTRGVAPGRQVFVVADSGVPEGLLQVAARSLVEAGFTIAAFGFTPSEEAKCLRSVEPLLRALAKYGHERDEPVVVLGGGVTGDLGGFAAAIYQRGTPVIQCPTTLLAMVDASVGGKTGVNLEALEEDGGEGALLKNFVGAFHQPRLVLADVDALASLDGRVLRCGLAECVKHAMIGGDGGDPSLWGWLESRLDDVLALRGPALVVLVERNVRVKAAIVAGDERERRPDGGRALLNLGHTFGHAIETLPGVSAGDAEGPLMHGEAVGLGLVAAAAASCELGLLGGAARDGLVRLLGRIGLPTQTAGLPGDDELLARMARDKKVRGGRLRLVLPADGATAVIRDDVPEEAVRAGLAAIRTRGQLT